jgi:hypothetical protein
MFSAIGYSQTLFFPTSPDRLCRGRERWISFETDPSEDSVHRTVFSGARFSDTSARDARRGIRCAGIGLGELLMAIFPGEKILAWAEETPCSIIPAGATGVERFQLSRPQQPLLGWYARWELECGSPDTIEQAVAAGADVLLVGPELTGEGQGPLQPVPPLFDDEDLPALLPEDFRRDLFFLTGSRLGGDSFCLFQSLALPGLSQRCRAVVLLHRDKHELCMGIYSTAPLVVGDAVVSLCKDRDCMAVPFSIPPMLARWDRAIWDLRDRWDADVNGPFPIPGRTKAPTSESLESPSAPPESSAAGGSDAPSAPPESSAAGGSDAPPAPPESSAAGGSDAPSAPVGTEGGSDSGESALPASTEAAAEPEVGPGSDIGDEQSTD